MRSRIIGTARTYALVGFVFYVLFALAVIIGVLIFAVSVLTSVSTPMPSNPPYSSQVIFFFPMFIPLIFFLLLIPAIALTIWAWFTVRNIDAGRYGRARTYSLILGIIGLIFGLLIGGVFFLLAYGKLAEITVQPLTVQIQLGRFCINCGRAVSSDARFCTHCGKELPP